MEEKNDAKVNILKGVNQKLKIKEAKIAILFTSIGLFIGMLIFFLLFIKQTPINASAFQNVHIERSLATINQVDDKALVYNHLCFTTKKSMFDLIPNTHFYVTNNEDNTATLYFYITENYIQKSRTGMTEPIPTDILLTPRLCKSDTPIAEITSVYYLVYNYDKINQIDFASAKQNATLLWKK